MTPYVSNQVSAKILSLLGSAAIVYGEDVPWPIHLLSTMIMAELGFGCSFGRENIWSWLTL